MADDQQTQTMPLDHDGIARVASFMAFENVDDFATALLESLGRVESHYDRLFEKAQADDAQAADWTFARETPDQRTAAAITALGFRDVARTYRRLWQWHQLGLRPNQDKRTLGLLQQMIPGFAQAAARMPHPDTALEALEAYLSRLHGSLRFFSTLSAYPSLLALVLEI